MSSPLYPNMRGLLQDTTDQIDSAPDWPTGFARGVAGTLALPLAYGHDQFFPPGWDNTEGVQNFASDLTSGLIPRSNARATAAAAAAKATVLRQMDWGSREGRQPRNHDTDQAASLERYIQQRDQNTALTAQRAADSKRLLSMGASPNAVPVNARTMGVGGNDLTNVIVREGRVSNARATGAPGSKAVASYTGFGRAPIAGEPAFQDRVDAASRTQSIGPPTQVLYDQLMANAQKHKAAGNPLGYTNTIRQLVALHPSLIAEQQQRLEEQKAAPGIDVARLKQYFIETGDMNALRQLERANKGEEAYPMMAAQPFTTLIDKDTGRTRRTVGMPNPNAR